MKRELGLYIFVRIVAVYAHTESVYADFTVFKVLE